MCGDRGGGIWAPAHPVMIDWLVGSQQTDVHPHPTPENSTRPTDPASNAAQKARDTIHTPKSLYNPRRVAFLYRPPPTTGYHSLWLSSSLISNPFNFLPPLGIWRTSFFSAFPNASFELFFRDFQLYVFRS